MQAEQELGDGEVGEEKTAVDLGIEGLEGAAPIGRGGFATVYRAWQPAFRRDVAVKLLHYARGDASALRRFDREVAAIGSVSAHPHIVSVYASGLTSDGTPYLVMEHLPNGTLAHRIGEGPVGWEEAVAVGTKLLSALQFAHGKGVLHSDIKPENVLLSAFGEPQLADFGIAKILGGTETRSGQTHLTIPHAPPEILDGVAPSPQSDLYAVASTVMTLILGRAPFHRDGETSFVPMFGRIVSEPAPDLCGWGVPFHVARTIAAAMAKDPTDRPASAGAMRAALEGAVPPPPPAATVPSPPTDTIEVIPDPAPAAAVTRARPPRRALVGALLAAALVVGGAAWVMSHGDDPPPAARTAAGVTSTPATGPSTPHATATAGQPFHTTRFRPALGLTLPAGWGAAGPELSTVMGFGAGDSEPLIRFAAPDSVLEPDQAYGTAAISPYARPLPGDLVGWLQQHPRLHVTDTSPVTIGGQPGTRVSFTVSRPYQYKYCTEPCVLLFTTGGRPMAYSSSVQLNILSVGGDQLLISQSAPRDSARAQGDQLAAILASVRFG
jgi:hypothetical protein